VDLARLLRILGALIGNAVKFGPANTTVRITAERHYEMISFSVIDHGMGIPEDQLPHVFDRLRQLGADPGRAPGVGLGLAIAKELVEAHGGTLSASSTHGKGSVFSFTLPTDGDDQA
jgi:signal transduction histidine kinase